MDLPAFEEYFGIKFQLQSLPPKEHLNFDLCIADVHAPFQVQDYEGIIEEASEFTENLYIDGDFFDFYSKSFYRKTSSIDFRTEFRKGYNLLQWTAQHFNKVYFQMANHDNRFAKWLFDNVPAELIEFCYYDIIEDLLKTIPNLEVVKQKVNHSREIGYIWQKDNAIFTHIEKSNSDVTKTVQDIEKLLPKWFNTLNLNPYNMVLQAHNHNSGKVRFGDKWLFQIPCLIDISAKAFDYVFNGKVYSNPPALGYVILAKNETGFDPRKSYVVDL